MRKRNPEKLVRRNFIITEAQDDFLSTLGSQQASAYIRKILSTQMGGHDVEISEIKASIQEKEALLNIDKAQLAELEKEKIILSDFRFKLISTFFYALVLRPSYEQTTFYTGTVSSGFKIIR